MKDVVLQLAHVRILELEEQLAQMSKLAHEDPLTGLLNRRGCETAFARELSRSARRQTPLSIVVLDIDNLKQINDLYGHATGDAALVHFAKVLGGALRTADIRARLGGEEFLIALPDTEMDQAECVIARAQKSLALALLEVGPATLALTFSAGLARFQSGDTVERLIDRADFGTRAAKQKGKTALSVPNGCVGNVYFPALQSIF